MFVIAPALHAGNGAPGGQGSHSAGAGGNGGNSWVGRGEDGGQWWRCGLEIDFFLI